MPFKRNWDSSCPIVWDRWEDKGVKWVIQDIPPEDDEEAIRILVKYLCKEEQLCSLSKISEDPESIESIKRFWRYFLRQRMSLGCYEEKDGQSKFVALNACVVMCEGEEVEKEIIGKSWNNVYHAVKLAEEKEDPFEYLGLDTLLAGAGLIVTQEYRGFGLGSRILRAREPLCLHHDIKGSATIFTGPASQRIAHKEGYTTIAITTLKDLAEAGLDYPDDENRSIHLMVKKFDEK